MGGDSRLFRPIRVPGAELLLPEHLPPEQGESLSAYAARTAARWGIGADDVIGGASFGGMLAAEIASTRPVAGVALLGSCLSTRGFGLKIAVLRRAVSFLPEWILALRSWRPLVRYRFAPVDPESEACLIAMAADCPSTHLRAFAQMILDWPGAAPSCPVLCLHGDTDRIIPLSCAENPIVIANAGHAFTLTHGAQVSDALARFVQQVRK